MLEISAPSRLHFGLFNATGHWGRQDGGAGIAIQDPSWRFTLGFSRKENVCTGLNDEFRDVVLDMLNRASLTSGRTFRLAIHSVVTSHVGLGSKTSLVMALARGLRELGIDLDMPDSRFAKRGGTSGVGVSLSQRGGIACDFGRPVEGELNFIPSSAASHREAPQAVTATVDARFHVVHWRFAEQGYSGEEERELFASAKSIEAEDARMSTATWYGQVFPSLLEGNEQASSQGLNLLQTLGMKRVEWSWQDQISRAFYEHFRKTVPEFSLGLSSTGPTMYSITQRPAFVLDAIRSFPINPKHLTVTTISRVGAQVQKEA